MGATELSDLLSSSLEKFMEMYRLYQHLRLKNWFVRSGLQYGAYFVAHCHRPTLVHS
ncbi:tRNA-splicing endonuclease subunit Sen2-2 [Zea mays]|jgi:tRNA-splicing endonuclease subunit Sen2|uniref:tRNA-intron lyase n=1 Tax=Zea mays TaxID=4577 RepID=A0A1D6J5J7_MAIZE|nr:tRNA-splicing endonuclease subunit Sen2-2 [Zea mays]